MARLRLPDWRDPRTRSRLVVWALVTAMVLITFVVSASGVTSTKWFCANFCHEMMPDIRAFDVSSHNRMSCYACHMPAGINSIGFFRHKLTNLQELVKHVTNNYEKPLNANQEYSLGESKAADCMQCHNSEPRLKAYISAELIMDHRAHFKKGIQCAWCHNRVAHPGLEAYQDFRQMEACFRCHTVEPITGKGQMLTPGGLVSSSSGAGTTQTLEASASVFAGPIAASIQKLKEYTGMSFRVPGNCDMCHPKGFNLKPADHGAGWLPKGHHEAFLRIRLKETGAAGTPSGRAITALVATGAAPAVESKPCGVCHAQSFCNACHGLVMPHPVNWTAIHHLYRANIYRCSSCHGGPDFCQRCHHNGVPTLKVWLSKAGHPAYVNKHGANGCFKCHDPRLCESCHIRGKADPRYI
jgi:nitrate/TMAO reductase-like tetraheme cytochrome c subunit